MRIISAAFRTGRDFLASYNPDITGGALLYRSRARFEPAEPVLLEVRIAGVPHRVLLRGGVARIDREAGGVWIAFLEEDHATRDFLLGIARGEVEVRASGRKHRRYPLELPADWTVRPAPAGDPVTSCVEDLSVSGAFLRTVTPPPPGTDLEVRLQPTAGETLEIPARVTWTRGGRTEGMGVAFQKNAPQTRRLRKLVRQMDESGKLALKP